METSLRELKTLLLMIRQQVRAAASDYQKCGRTQMDRKAVSILMTVISGTITSTGKSLMTLTGDDLTKQQLDSITGVFDLAHECHNLCLKLLNIFKDDDPSMVSSAELDMAKPPIDLKLPPTKPEDN